MLLDLYWTVEYEMPLGPLHEDNKQGGGQMDQELRLRQHNQSGS